MSFPQNRYALVTAAAGKFAKADAKCPARVVMDRTKGFGLPAAALSAAYTAPCAGEWWRGGHFAILQAPRCCSCLRRSVAHVS